MVRRGIRKRSGSPGRLASLLLIRIGHLRDDFPECLLRPTPRTTPRWPSGRANRFREDAGWVSGPERGPGYPEGPNLGPGWVYPIQVRDASPGRETLTR